MKGVCLQNLASQQVETVHPSLFYIFSQGKYRKEEKTQQNITRGSVQSGQAALDRARDMPVLLAGNNQGRSLLSNYTF